MSEIHFAQYDASQLRADAIARFESALGVNLGEGDERRIIINTVLDIMLGMYAAIDDAGRQNLLNYARGDNLDAIGQTRGIKRLASAPSKATVRFTLSAVQGINVIVPAGTRVTPNGELFWATDSTLVIAAGASYGDVSVTCLDAGSDTNGYAVGALKIIVDPIAYVASASNLTATSGGTDAESDESYRTRLREANATYSTAGSAESYRYYARSASGDVQDVFVSSPSAGEILITVLARSEARDSDGETPQALLDAVTAACSADTVRPLTDHVTAQSATPVTYNVVVNYYVDPQDESRVVNAIEGAGGALEEYYEWQGAKLGRAINPDRLRTFLIQAGAQWAEVTLPTLAQLGTDEYAHLGTATITHAVITGMED